MKKNSDKAEDIKLIPMKDFRAGVARIICNTKKESDEQISDLQASNLRKRQTKKKR
jgi:hypothetical protein